MRRIGFNMIQHDSTNQHAMYSIRVPLRPEARNADFFACNGYHNVLTNTQPQEAVKSSLQIKCFQALIEFSSKFQGPKTTWKIHSFKRLVEFLAKCQTLKTGWQVHSLQGLIEFMAKI